MQDPGDDVEIPNVSVRGSGRTVVGDCDIATALVTIPFMLPFPFFCAGACMALFCVSRQRVIFDNIREEIRHYTWGGLACAPALCPCWISATVIPYSDVTAVVDVDPSLDPSMDRNNVAYGYRSDRYYGSSNTSTACCYFSAIEIQTRSSGNIVVKQKSGCTSCLPCLAKDAETIIRRTGLPSSAQASRFAGSGSGPSDASYPAPVTHNDSPDEDFDQELGQVSPQAKTCPSCGYLVTDAQTQFCGKCGTHLIKKCSECGAEATDSSLKFCGHCGTAI
jgi:ribosomal protein S27AE